VRCAGTTRAVLAIRWPRRTCSSSAPLGVVARRDVHVEELGAGLPKIDHITRTAHYESFTVSGTGYSDNAARPPGGAGRAQRSGGGALCERGASREGGRKREGEEGPTWCRLVRMQQGRHLPSAWLSSLPQLPGPGTAAKGG
jgi:hypothetical protein